MEESIKICVTCLSRDRRLVPVLTLTALLQEIHFEELKESSGEVCWECWSILVKFYKFKNRAKIAHEILSQTTENFNIKSLTTLSKTNIIFSEYDYSYNFNYEIDDNFIKEENPNQMDDHIDQIDDHFNQIHETLQIDENPIAKSEKNISFYSEADIKESKQNINVSVKQEKCFEDDQVIVNETHKPNEHTEKSETVDTKPTKKLLSRTARSQKKDFKTVEKISQIAIKGTGDKEFEEKFVQVVLTEEEMLQGREERRSHPSFRTLPFICNGCLLGFRKEAKYRIHMQKKHDERIGNLTCNICGIRFPHNLALSKHKIKHYVVYRCKLCRYQGNNLQSAINHCNNKHAGDKPDSIHCSQCKFVAKNSQDLERHMETDHRFWCNECGEKFTLKRNIRIHFNRTHGLRPFKCEICKKGFKTKPQLESHMARHNDSIAKKLSYCEECNIQYKTIVIYRSHLKNNANHSEGYPCPECDKKFKGKSYLKQHYDFHHLHRSRYKCEVCNKIFSSKSHLNIHKARHLGKDRPRKYSCDICPKRFFSSQVLINHQLTHTDERKFMCEDCGDTFKQRACLFTHTRLKHKGWRKRKPET